MFLFLGLSQDRKGDTVLVALFLERNKREMESTGINRSTSDLLLHVSLFQSAEAKHVKKSGSEGGHLYPSIIVTVLTVIVLFLLSYCLN